MQLIEIRPIGSAEATLATIDAPTKTAAWHLAVERLAADPRQRSFSFDIKGRATAAQRRDLPTIDQAIQSAA